MFLLSNLVKLIISDPAKLRGRIVYVLASPAVLPDGPKWMCEKSFSLKTGAFLYLLSAMLVYRLMTRQRNLYQEQC